MVSGACGSDSLFEKPRKNSLTGSGLLIAVAIATASPRLAQLLYHRCLDYTKPDAFKPSGQIMKIRRLDHVQLAMPACREDDARAFYQGMLGIPEVAKPAHLAARGGCWFEHGDLKVHLGVDKEFVPARKAHPAFIVADLLSLVQSLRDAGYSVVADQPLEGYERMYVDDPFGNRIELMRPTG
jgi:catechol 2,3-dioxygenase-like lactoylglutathione lyase family enzyme